MKDDEMTWKCLISHRGAIEKDAGAAVAEFNMRARKSRLCRPIPIEDIVEKHLKLTSGVRRSCTACLACRVAGGRTGYLRGDLWMNSRESFIDRKLWTRGEPVEGGPLSFHAGARGRRALAAASALFATDSATDCLFKEPAKPGVVSAVRAKRKNPSSGRRISYASCLLMPRKLVMPNGGRDVFPDRKPLVFSS